ncbi:MAG: hypothetical protein D6696_19360 [Acidobacteria bacterium]|nr:MAG: hypothetical protein D6696_19360 [Acidobacteriota bacterium]
MRSGSPWALEVTWRADDPSLMLHLGVAMNRTSDGIEVCAFGTHRDGLEPFTGRRRYRLRLEIPELALVKGEVTLYVYLLDEAGLHVWDQRVLPAAFEVESPGYHFGVCTMPHRWRIEHDEAPETAAATAMEMMPV